MNEKYTPSLIEINGNRLDCALIPYHLVWWLIAYLWTLIWGLLIFFKFGSYNWQNYWWCFMWGRHNSPEPTICPSCLWAGPRRWCYHGYSGEESEPTDECPRCGYEI